VAEQRITGYLLMRYYVWLLRTSAPWRDLLSEYGGWKNTHRQFCRWHNMGEWEGLLEKRLDNPDFQWLMLGASYLKMHMPKMLLHYYSPRSKSPASQFGPISHDSST
jgi:hypothetical protein